MIADSYLTTRSRRALRASSFATALALIVGAVSTPAFADQKADLHVLRIFSEGATTAGFYPVENIWADCAWGLIYVDLSNVAGRGQLALLMQAKAQNLKLQRVDYTKAPSGTCTLTGLHIE